MGNNYNFDFDSKKYMILLCAICLIFVLLIIKAFDYLPSNQSQSYDMTGKNNQQQIETTNNENSEENNNNDDDDDENSDEEDESDDDYDENHKTGHFDFVPKVSNESNDLPEIKAPAGTYEDNISKTSNKTDSYLNQEEQAIKIILNAQNLKSQGDDSAALKELEKIPALTTDREINALCSEKMAEIYATRKNYDIALAFAEKANNLSPSDARKMLIARINYQSGNTANAATTVNDIIKKGF